MRAPASIGAKWRCPSTSPGNSVVRDALVETMWGGPCPSPLAANNRSSSPTAQRVDVRPPMAMKALSQLHWCGYRSGAALVRHRHRLLRKPSTEAAHKPFVSPVHLSCRPLVADRPISPTFSCRNDRLRRKYVG